MVIRKALVKLFYKEIQVGQVKVLQFLTLTILIFQIQMMNIVTMIDINIIKFKFVVSGMMGEFNTNNLVNHLTSGIVLSNMSTMIVSLVILYSATAYGKKIQRNLYL